MLAKSHFKCSNVLGFVVDIDDPCVNRSSFSRKSKSFFDGINQHMKR